MSRAYSAIVRSLEKNPTRAVLSSVRRVHCTVSTKSPPAWRFAHAAGVSDMSRATAVRIPRTASPFGGTRRWLRSALLRGDGRYGCEVGDGDDAIETRELEHRPDRVVQS